MSTCIRAAASTPGSVAPSKSDGNGRVPGVTARSAPTSCHAAASWPRSTVTKMVELNAPIATVTSSTISGRLPTSPVRAARRRPNAGTMPRQPSANQPATRSGSG